MLGRTQASFWILVARLRRHKTRSFIQSMRLALPALALPEYAIPIKVSAWRLLANVRGNPAQ